MWITGAQNTLFASRVTHGTKQQQRTTSLRARCGSLSLSRGAASLLDFTDQEATAGGLWVPSFLRQRTRTGRFSGRVLTWHCKENYSHDGMCVVTQGPV